MRKRLQPTAHALAACSILAIGCSDDSPSHEPTGRTRSLKFELAGGTWPEASDELVREIPMPTTVGALDGPSWQSTSKHARCIQHRAADGTESTAIGIAQGAGDLRLRIPLEPGQPRFDVVRIRLTAEGFARVAAFVRKDMREIVRSEFAEFATVDEPTAFDLEVDELPYAKLEPNLLELLVQGATRPTILESVELRRRSSAVRLPGPDAWPSYAAVGNDYRPAYSLLPGIELAASWNPLAPAQRLEVDVAPTLTSGEVERAKATLTLRVGGETVATRAVTPRPEWTTVSFPLADFADREGTRTLTATTDSAHGLFVSDARLVDPRDAGAAQTVVLITSDTHRSDHVGYAPDGAGVRTPVIDALASRGTRFLDAWSVTSITNPSHASILSGVSMRDTGVLGNLVILSDRAKMLAEHYRDAGYRTFAAVSARHLVPPRSGFGQGFERFDGPRISMTRDGKETIAQAEAMLDRAKGEDVFLWLHLFDVHAPYRPHDEFIDEYYEGDPFAERAEKIAPKAVAVWNKRVRDAKYILALYKNEVSYLDQLLGTFFQANPRVGRGLVALTADHGESHGENGIYWKHSGIYPSTLRVPLILAGPGIPEGEIVTRPVANLDIGRTLIDLSTGPDGEFAGASLLQDTGSTPRFTISPNGIAAGVSSGPWYLLLHLRDNGWAQVARPNRHKVELYHLGNDPGATTNLADDEPEQTRRLWSALVDWLASTPEGGVLAGEVTSSADAKADVAALGYMADAESKVEGTLIDANCSCENCRRLREE